MVSLSAYQKELNRIWVVRKLIKHQSNFRNYIVYICEKVGRLRHGLAKSLHRSSYVVLFKIHNHTNFLITILITIPIFIHQFSYLYGPIQFYFYWFDFWLFLTWSPKTAYNLPYISKNRTILINIFIRWIIGWVSKKYLKILVSKGILKNLLFIHADA